LVSVCCALAYVVTKSNKAGKNFRFMVNCFLRFVNAVLPAMPYCVFTSH
jgi:hypothetical protein